eukprot:Tamp_04477.p1 GENE.Tamp_04477~~Tamp_04477.p1  ORF type:complete len:444 (-),score=78.95 Tamp_04477:1802-3133(-)
MVRRRAPPAEPSSTDWHMMTQAERERARGTASWSWQRELVTCAALGVLATYLAGFVHPQSVLARSVAALAGGFWWFPWQRARPPAHLEPVVTTAHVATAHELVLANLGITALTTDLFSFSNTLELLRLSNNGVSSVKKDIFAGLTNLRMLYLDRNKIDSLSSQAFRKLQKLQHLDLSGNMLTKISSSVFKGLHNLEMLSLGGNRLKTLPDRAFEDLLRLEHLSLNYNEIERLPPDAFAGLGNLKRLFLYQNKLADLPDDIFNPLASLQVLILENNPMNALPPSVYRGLVMILAERNELDCEAGPDSTSGTCTRPYPLNYVGPCWDETGAVTYDEQRGYFFSYAADERVEGRVTGVEGMGESGAAVSAGAQVREFNVSVLVEVGMFCGLGPGARRKALSDVWGMFAPLDWWSVQGFLALSVTVSCVPGWVRYLLIAWFVYAALS